MLGEVVHSESSLPSPCSGGSKTCVKKNYVIIIHFHRWRMVVHGAIDGYSCLVVFLHCSNNNRAETVLQLFMKAVTEFGLPS